MKNTTKFVAAAVGVALCASLVCAGCGRGRDGGHAPVRLTYSIFFGPTHTNSLLAAEWGRELAKRTDGRVTVDLFYGGSLTKADQCYQGVVYGVSDIGMSCLAYTRGRFPLLEGLDLPVGYPDGMAATRIANALADKYAGDLRELSEVKLMYLHAHGPGVLASKEPVRSMDDVKGLKIRATGLSSKIALSLGAVPIGMSQGDTYDALRKGVVDATLCPIETLFGWRQGEVVGSVTDAKEVGYTTTMFVVMNKKTWERLPEDIQGVIVQLNKEFAGRHGEAWNAADDEGREFIRSRGCTEVSLSENEGARWRKAVDPVLSQYAEATDRRGLPGAAFLDDLRRMVRESREMESGNGEEVAR